MFWPKAEDAAEKQRAFLTHVLERETVISLVYERAGVVAGFVIGSLVPAPPVYNPGGPTCSVDDFVVPQDEWDTIGAALLDAVAHEAEAHGAAQMVVVSAQLDAEKRQMLSDRKYAAASEWWVRSLLAEDEPPKNH
ncbi:GNAT family N-acetyltransferase [Deinococcus sp.]|uniref:GNAT family N-acetyltransferase n=1 Tax=Deinococcus sp. TaxID=47478 RepID=UPI003B5AB39C